MIRGAAVVGAALLLGAATTPPAEPTIAPDRIEAHVRALSSDAFFGRGPGEAGEDRTIKYLVRAFTALGLEPAGDNGGFLQDVPLVRMDRLPGAAMSLARAGRVTPLLPGRDAALTLRNAGATDIADAQLVFAGFGIVDAAKGWDAYAGVDMAGKVAVVLANDPDFEGDADLGFEGRRMAYPGRVGVKAEAAARAGAVAMLVIHEDAAASYPFLQVGSGDALPAFVPAPTAPSTLQASGWLRGDLATRLLGVDLSALKREARRATFRARTLPGAMLSFSGEVRATPVVSRNVVGRLRGSSRPDEVVLYGAHWDANGANGPDGRGDGIRNGAIDNAVGTAELLEVARAFVSGPRPDRSVVFALWTAEEKGLLGAEHYATHPRFPLSRTAAVLNLDPHVALPSARNLELIGGGRSPLEVDLARIAGTMGLRVDPEPNPEAGWYFRSDHFAFAKRGVPTVYFRAGRDLVRGGRSAGDALVDPYNAQRYHQPSDEFGPSLSFDGPSQETTVAYRLGRELANSAAWPAWNAGVDYGVVRAQSNAERR